MKILAVDTSSKNCSVSIIEVDNNEKQKFNVIISENNDNEKTHSQKLMPMIDEIFNKTGLTLDNIDLLACCLGPGSFTGIRIGIATVKAFADVKNIPTVGVTSLESLAYNTWDSSNADCIVCPIIDCKNENVYSALFSRKDYTYTQIGDNIADNINNVLDKFISTLSDKIGNEQTFEITFIGDGSILYKDLIITKFSENETLKNCKLTFSNDNIQSSISLTKCAYEKYLNGLFGDSNYISPLYLRKSQAERANDGEK